jgi:ADP-ribose pyrophosphatase YjhB (NUDIX family)
MDTAAVAMVRSGKGFTPRLRSLLKKPTLQAAQPGSPWFGFVSMSVRESRNPRASPGGKLEDGETLADALVREMKEETGLDVEPVRLLYVCDNLPAQVVHMTFEARRTGGTVGDIKAGADTTPIRSVDFVKLSELPALGFSGRFTELAIAGFPGAGSYMGPKSAIGL